MWRLSWMLVKSNEDSLGTQRTYSIVGEIDKSKSNFNSLFKCPQLGFFERSFISEMPN